MKIVAITLFASSLPPERPLERRMLVPILSKYHQNIMEFKTWPFLCICLHWLLDESTGRSQREKRNSPLWDCQGLFSLVSLSSFFLHISLDKETRRPRGYSFVFLCAFIKEPGETLSTPSFYKANFYTKDTD